MAERDAAAVIRNANHGAMVLTDYVKVVGDLGGSLEDNIVHLLVDVMHLAESLSMDPQGLVDRARTHYDTERGGEGA